jgi:short-subunit dehydrogenase
MTVEDFEEAMGIMFWGALYPTLAVLPQMLRRKSGRIVNITSVGGKVSAPHLLPYGCAKFAHVALSEGLRAELASQGISVITVTPGMMRTGSYQNAFFKGRQEREFTWFALGSSLPGISMDAERAARRIVRATKRGEPELILTVAANALARYHGLFPAATTRLLAVANRMVLPSPEEGDTARARGQEIDRRLDSSLLDTITAWGISAARRFHEYPGP